jgi:transcription antitermination protein NusB
MADPHDQPDAPDSGASPRGTKERRGRRRVDTRDPRRSRERALKILFQADVRGDDAGVLLASIVDDPRAWAMLDDLDPDEAADLAPGVDAGDAEADPEPHLVALEARRRKALELDGFTRSLVQGVADHQADLDELIQRYARRWSVARMPAIDRNLLRLGTYELRHEVTSPAVVINEVIELAKRLSTEDSGRYVNGVLEAVRKHLAADRAAVPTEAVPPEIDPVVPDAVAPADRDEGDVPVPRPSPDDAVEGGAVEDAPLEGAPVEDAIVEDAPLDETPLDETPLEDTLLEDVLPPPDDEGDAVDLIAGAADLEPGEGEDLDAAADDTGDEVDEDGDDAPGQQQLF